jgi:hypothetical protein
MILGRLGHGLRGAQLPCGRMVGYYFPDDEVVGLLEDRVPVGNLDRDERFQPYREAANDAAAGLVVA